MIKIKVKGNTRKTESFLRREHKLPRESLEYFGQRGVEALMAATPIRTGTTALSWSYEIVEDEIDDTVSIVFKNSNVSEGFPVALLIQYGHGTKSGTYVQGIDYINPALEPIFDDMAKKAWAEVIR